MKKSNLFFSSFTLFLIPIFLMNSCAKDVGVLKKKSSLDNCDSLSNYTYTNYVASVLNNNCTFSGCHNAGSSNGDFTTYLGIKINVDNGTFLNRVLVTKDMPPSYTTGPSTLSDCDLLKLKKWLDAGAPQ
jgi:hypothetical protein